MSVHRYWLGLGANLGDRRAALRAMLDALAGDGVAIEAVSRVYESAPRDLEDQPAFLNAAARARTSLSPTELLDLVKALERRLGRVQGVRYGPRAIDCDLLLWSGGDWTDDRLVVPHPRLAERRFALVPLLDLDPALRLPDGRAVADLARAIDPGAQPVRAVGGRRLDCGVLGSGGGGRARDVAHGRA